MVISGDEFSTTTPDDPYAPGELMRPVAKLSTLAVLAMFAGGTAHAAPSISITDFSDPVLSGTAEFPELGRESVVSEFATRSGFQPTGAEDVPPEVQAALGLDLVDAFIEPIEGGLRFTWGLGSPIEVVPPEGLRYNWSFTVGGQAYQLQAKVTNMASTTTVDAPQAHVEQLAAGQEFFQLRGACTASYMGTPVAGCFHLAFLDGEFDYEAGEVSIDLPYGTSFAPDIVAGVTIVEAASAGMSIAASLQAGVSNTLVSAYINGWDAYRTAPSVMANRVSTGTDPRFASYDDPMTLAEDNSWSGEVDGSGPLVVARACHGATCSYDTLAL
jgi:hypothetical protein